MSHRDSLIKKNKELSKPMDIMNVGFVGVSREAAETLTGVGDGGSGTAASLVGTTTTGSYYTQLWDWNWTDDHDITTHSQLYTHPSTSQRKNGNVVWDWGSDGGNATGNSLELSHAVDGASYASTVFAYRTSSGSWIDFETSQPSTTTTTRYNLGQFRYIKMTVSHGSTVAFTTHKVYGLYRITP